jgi:hypothetical protein
MKRKSLIILFCLVSISCPGGTAGPSDDEIYLLIIPLILLTLYLGIPPIIKFLRTKFFEWRERHLINHENGFPEV